MLFMIITFFYHKGNRIDQSAFTALLNCFFALPADTPPLNNPVPESAPWNILWKSFLQLHQYEPAYIPQHVLLHVPLFKSFLLSVPM